MADIGRPRRVIEVEPDVPAAPEPAAPEHDEPAPVPA
jgi:hypothetical protein